MLYSLNPFSRTKHRRHKRRKPNTFRHHKKHSRKHSRRHSIRQSRNHRKMRGG